MIEEYFRLAELNRKQINFKNFVISRFKKKNSVRTNKRKNK